MKPTQTDLIQRVSSALKGNRLLVGLSAAFVVAASITAWLAFTSVRTMVASWNPVDSGPGALAQGEEDVGAFSIDTGSPLQPQGGPTPRPWDGTSRVTILVLGLDHRDWEVDQGPPRTDTMLLFTLDPVSRSAGMISIPRDLWVSIPTLGNNKINTAYRLGVVYDVPGGGEGLTVSTVENLLGVPINFYALVEFDAFVRLIDELGGIEVDVPETIPVDPVGPGNTVVLPPGPNLMNGEVALAYARARDTVGGDFDRADRQQQVIMAIRDRVLSLDMLTTLISKAPRLYQEVASSIQTNLSVDQAIRLGLMASQIQEDAIRRVVIGPDHVDFGMSPEGLDILIPRLEAIRQVRDEVFVDDSGTAPIAVATNPAELVTAEAARVAVLNGTFTPGLAAETSDYLIGLGLDVTVIGNATQTFNQTTVIDYSGKPYTVQYLVDNLNIAPNRIFSSYDAASQVDVEVNLGSDWSLPNPASP